MKTKEKTDTVKRSKLKCFQNIEISIKNIIVLNFIKYFFKLCIKNWIDITRKKQDLFLNNTVFLPIFLWRSGVNTCIVDALLKIKHTFWETVIVIYWFNLIVAVAVARDLKGLDIIFLYIPKAEKNVSSVECNFGYYYNLQSSAL